MSNLLDRLHIRHEARQHAPETTERVPESRELVEHHRRVTEPPRRAASGIRWLRWIPVVILMAGGILGVTMLVTDNGSDEAIEWTTVSEGPGSNSLGPIVAPSTANSAQLVQESIDQALAANQPTTLDVIVSDLEENTAIRPVSSYQLVQESIDAALAANQPVSSYQLVQESIDAALAANEATAVDDSFEVAEQARFEALNPNLVDDGSFEVAEQARFEALNPNLVDDGSFEGAEQARFERLRPSNG